jgi:gas vesicle structural protein
MAVAPVPNGPSGGALTEVLELILDRGVVIDVFVRVSLVGIEILTIDARVVVASVDTYLRYAEAVGRVQLDTPKRGVPDLIEGRKTAGAIEAVTDKLGELFGPPPEPVKEETS